MLGSLRVDVGQASQAGRKSVNQDAHGATVPEEPALTLKGVALAIADGISSSDVSDIASQSAIRTFLDDYYATPEAWSVKTSGERVLATINAWLFSQTQRSEYRFERDRGYVSTFSALVLKGRSAHVLHVGDTRVYRHANGRLELLTQDHRVRLSVEENYLERALGAAASVVVDYYRTELREGETFVLATDGVYEHVTEARFLEELTDLDSLDATATRLVELALEAGSEDNLTVQLAHVVALPDTTTPETLEESSVLPVAPVLEAGATFEHYRIISELHSSHRSHVYLAKDETTGDRLALKVLANDAREDPEALQRFFLEEWIARRIKSPHVLRAYLPNQARRFHYVATEYVEGRTLAQWMVDHPRPDIETVRRIVEQIAKGLQAFHRQEMLHRDLRPENILIDSAGFVKIIDFGSVWVAGLSDVYPALDRTTVPGTLQYAAPEYFLGEPGTVQSDLYSLGVVTYQLLSGRLPYGDAVPRARTRAAQMRLTYTSVLAKDREIPAWLDFTLRKAVHPNPRGRYSELSEFVFDLRRPSAEAAARATLPLAERNPVLFWKLLAFGSLVLWLVTLVSRR